MYAILNRQQDEFDTFFGVEYGPTDEPNAGYQAAVFAAGFRTSEEMDKFAAEKDIHLT
jgi:hypothetical protein